MLLELHGSRTRPHAQGQYSADDLDLNEDEFLVAAIEDVVLDAGRAEIGDAARQIREQLLPALHDPHAPDSHRNDNVIVLVTMEAGTSACGQAVASDTYPRIVELAI